MLEVLCGNKNVQRILLFLFVNGKCYGTQLHRALKAPLTPLQKALNRLERGGLITSHYEGKTRLYQFNPAYPLMSEVEQLLKKAYTILPSQLKKDYYVVKEEISERNQVLLGFWDRLSQVTTITVHAKSGARGRGEVHTVKEGIKLVFTEKGAWEGGKVVAFSNILRWTLDRPSGVVSLEHLRRGPDHPVFLFHLAPSGKNSLTSVDSHLCGGDTYFGQIHFDPHSIRLNWRVIGPKKNEEIDYFYS